MVKNTVLCLLQLYVHYDRIFLYKQKFFKEYTQLMLLIDIFKQTCSFKPEMLALVIIHLLSEDELSEKVI